MTRPKEIRDTAVLQCRKCKEIERVGAYPSIEEGDKVEMKCSGCSFINGEPIIRDFKIIEIHTPEK